MNNPKSVRFIVAFSITVGLLHFVIGPDYQGIFKDFVKGYLMDLLLPANLYLLLQLALRKRLAVRTSRWIGGAFTFLFGTFVEVLQYYEIDIFGNTFDPIDIVMYAVGTIAAIVLDLTVITALEEKNTKGHHKQ